MMISSLMIVASLLVISSAELYPHTPTEFFYDSLIDHFNAKGNSATYKMRYIVNA